MAEKQIVIIGSAAIGKTTLCKCLTVPEGSFDFDGTRIKPTILGNHTGEGFKFHDAGGKPAYDMLRLSIYRRDKIGAVLVCFGLDSRSSFDELLTKFISEAGNCCTKGSTTPPLLLVGLKQDLGICCVEQSEIDEVLSTEQLHSYTAVSVKNGVGLSELADKIRGADLGPRIRREPRVLGESESADADASSMDSASSMDPSDESETSASASSSSSSSVGRKKATSGLPLPKKKGLLRRSLRDDSGSNSSSASSASDSSSSSSSSAAASASSAASSSSSSSSHWSAVSAEAKKPRRRGGIFGRRKKKSADEIEPDDASHEIHHVSFGDDRSRLLELIQLGVDVNMQDKAMNTPLHYACQQNAVSCVRALLNCRDLDANLYNSNGDTPLIITARKGLHSLIDSLIATGIADPNKPTRGGEMPVDVGSASSLTARVFAKQREREAEFIAAVEAKDLEGVRSRIHRVNVNCVNDEMQTPLAISMKSPGNEEIIELLVSSGADFTKATFADAPDYAELMERKLRWKRREDIIVDLLKTEKTFVEETGILLKHFATPFVSKSARLFRNASSRQKVGDMFAGLSMVRTVNLKLILGLVSIMNAPGTFDHSAVAELFSPSRFKLDPYVLFVKNQIFVTQELKTNKDFSSFWSWIQSQQKKFPRPVNFKSLIARPRFRVAKYHGYLQRMFKLTDPSEESLYSSLEEVSAAVKTSLDVIEKKARRMKNRFKLIEISKVFDSKYNVTSLHEDQKRRYVLHEMGLTILWAHNPRKRPTIDLFVFNDSIAFGDTGRNLTSFLFRESKVIISVHRDNIRFTVYRELTMVEDILLRLEDAQTWQKELDSAFSNFRYRAKVLLLTNVGEMERMNDFLTVRIDPSDVIALKESEVADAKKRLDSFNQSREKLQTTVSRLESELVDVRTEEEEKRRIERERRNRARELKLAARRDAEEKARMAEVQARAEAQLKQSRKKPSRRRAKKRGGSRSDLERFVFDPSAVAARKKTRISSPSPVDELGEESIEEDTRGLDQFNLLQKRLVGAQEEDTYGLRGTKDLGAIFQIEGGRGTMVNSIRDRFEGKTQSPKSMEDIKTDLAHTREEDEIDVDALLAGQTSTFDAAKMTFSGMSSSTPGGSGVDVLGDLMAQMSALTADLDS